MGVKLLIRLLCLLLFAGPAFAQQIQVLQDTDSLKTRREKENANFALLSSQVTSQTSLLSGQVAALQLRSLTAGTGLTGGGNLLADRVFSVVPDSTVQRVQVLDQGTLIGTRPSINFLPGANVTLAIFDNPGANRVDVTISATGGGGGGGGDLGDPGANGIVVRTALNTTVARTLTGTANQIVATNGSGVSGNPTISLAQNLTWGDGSQSTLVHTFNVSTGTDPVLTAGNGFIDISTGELRQGGVAVTTPSAVQVFTHKTFDAEATGNILTTVSRISIDGAGCDAGTASPNWDLPTSGAPTASCTGTTTTVGSLDFADAATTSATRHLRLPSDWTGSVDVNLAWLANSSSTNAVRWQVSCGCVADNEAVSIGPSYNASSASNAAYTGSANQRATTSFSSIATTNCAAGETLWLRVQRVGADGGDTLAATARLLEVTLVLRRAQ
jgi:hypothetical protein